MYAGIEERQTTNTNNMNNLDTPVRPLPGRVPKILEGPISDIRELMRQSDKDKVNKLIAALSRAKRLYSLVKYSEDALGHSVLRQISLCDNGVLIIHIAIRQTVDKSGNMRHVYVRNIHPF